MPSPICFVDNQSTIDGVNVAAGASVTIQLADLSGVNQWSIACTNTDNNNDAETITDSLVIDNLNKTATFTISSDGYGSALQFTSIVNNGYDLNGTAQSSYTTTFGIFVLNVYNGARKLFTNQTTEGDHEFGWTTDFNYFVDQFSAGGGSGFTAGGDLTGSSSSQTVVSLTGAGGIVTGPATALTLGSSVPATGLLRIQNNQKINWRNFSDSADLVGAYYDTDNYLQLGNSTATSRLQLAGAAGDCILSVGNTTSFRFSSTKCNTETPTYEFYAAVAAPKWTQADKTTNSGTGETFTIQAQNETGTTSTGGALVLQSGTGTSLPGNVLIKAGSSTIATLNTNGCDFSASGGNVTFSAGAASILSSATYTMLNSPITYLASGAGGRIRFDISSTANSMKGLDTITSLTIGFDDLTTNSGTGAPLVLRAQNETGTTSIGGKLTLASGSGTSQYGHVETAGPALTGLLAFTFSSDANQTLTAAQSANNIIVIADGVIGSARTITLSRIATAGSWLFVYNNNTYGVDIKWGSGSSANVGSGSGAVVFFDGTNAIAL